MIRRATLALLCAAGGFAQSQTGRIEGYVLDDSGMPLRGVEVEAFSSTQIGGKKKLTTDDTGEFRFVGLTPGRFDVRASKAGLTSDERKNLWVGVNATVTLTFLLAKPEAKQEVYVVKAEKPIVDTKRAAGGERIPREVAEKVPVVFRRPQAVTDFTPGVVQVDPGRGNPNIRGGANFNNLYTVDGVDTTDPVTHTFGTNFNFDAVIDTDVRTSALGAEYGMVSGGVANLVTKSGSNEFHLDSSVYHQDDNLALKDPDEAGATFREENINVNLDGPIVRDRLWYFASVQYDDRVSSIPCDEDALPGLCPHPSLKRRGVLYLLKLTGQATARQKLTLWTQGEFTSIANLAQDPTVAPEAESHQDQQTQIVSASHDWLITDKWFLRTQLSFQRQRLEVFPESRDFETPGYLADSITGISSGNYTRITDDRRFRLSAQQTLTWFMDRPFPRWYFSMEPHLGYRFWYAWNPQTERVPGDLTLRFSNGEPGAQSIHCLELDESLDRSDPDRCVEGTLETTTKGIFTTVFFDDVIKPRRNLTITPGVGFHMGRTINDAGDTVTDLKALTPHLNATWDPLSDGKTVVRGGYNEYVDVGFLSVPNFVGRQMFTETCDWDEAAQAYVANCSRFGGEGSVTVGQPDPTDPSHKTELRPPRTYEVMAGLERQVAEGTSIGGEFVYRRYSHLFEDVETNLIWNERGNDVVGSRDPERPGQVIFDLETPDEARRRYISWSLTARRFTGRWNILASYTWARSRGTVNEGFATEFLDNPTQSIYYDGFLHDDRRHALKVYGAIDVTKSLTLGASLQYATGRPYEKKFFNDFYRQFQDFRAQRGMDPNDINDPEDDTELRYPDLVEASLKLVFNFSELTGQNLDVIAEVFNLFNANTPIEVEDRALGPEAPVQFGDTIDRLDPLRVRVGLRYRY